MSDHDWKGTKNTGGDPSLGTNFRVDYGAAPLKYVFELSGMSDTSEMVKVHHGDAKAGQVAQQAGLPRHDPITIKCYMTGDGQLAREWKKVVDATTKQIVRSPLAIQILSDDGSNVAMEFIYHDAWMTSYEVSTFDAKSSDLLQEIGVFHYEHLEVKTA